ncbi:hypothetical protein C8R46DRAFT_1351221 [Mycena filopes]|nr:hypothetical protein C8R46DRAFT_1351221 [Mycena filopes]
MTETATDEQIQEAIYISRILIIVPFTILVYEYLLTLAREASDFWQTPFTYASFFFYLNRYTSLLGTLPIVVQYFSTTTDQSKQPVRRRLLCLFRPCVPRLINELAQLCRALRAYHQYFALLSQVLVAVMLIMRTFALYQRNRTILAFMIAVTLGAFGFAVGILLSGNNIDTLAPNIAAFGCPEGTSHAKSLRLAAAWSGMLVFDIMIFALTLYQAFRMNARPARVGGGRAGQGGGGGGGGGAASVMISRLMFNLRDPRLRSGARARVPNSTGLTRSTASSSEAAMTTMSPYGTEYAMDTMDGGWTRDGDEG